MQNGNNKLYEVQIINETKFQKYSTNRICKIGEYSANLLLLLYFSAFETNGIWFFFFTSSIYWEDDLLHFFKNQKKCGMKQVGKKKKTNLFMSHPIYECQRSM